MYLFTLAKRYPRLKLLLVFVLAIISMIFSLFKGSTSLSVYQLLFTENGQFNTIFFELRLPRVLTAFVCGGLLALAGSLMQLLLQNPMADPYALGVSGGAAFFSLLMMLLGVSEIGLFSGAWFGSLFTILVILSLAKKHRFNPYALLLSGIALACGFSAGISFILMISEEAHVRSMLFWLAGDLSGASFPWLGLSVLSIGFLICLLLAPGLNLLGRGEHEASALGLAVKKYRLLLYLLSSFLTATAVMLAGCVGFIGLIIPHLVRQLFGYNHRLMLPLAILLGGSLLTLADTFARSFFAPQQIPVGLCIALIGIPIYLWMMQKNGRA